MTWHSQAVLLYGYPLVFGLFSGVMILTGLTWGSLSTHLSRLEAAGFVVIEKEFIGKKPHSTIRLTSQGRQAFKEFKKSLQQLLDDLPE